MGDGATREAACQGKHTFPTMAAARKVAGEMNRKRKRPRGKSDRGRGASPVEAFRCQFCGLFHIGSNGVKIRNARPDRQQRRRFNERLRVQYLDR